MASWAESGPRPWSIGPEAGSTWRPEKARQAFAGRPSPWPQSAGVAHASRRRGARSLRGHHTDGLCRGAACGILAVGGRGWGSPEKHRWRNSEVLDKEKTAGAHLGGLVRRGSGAENGRRRSTATEVGSCSPKRTRTR
jgi:hypothetical protein